MSDLRIAGASKGGLVNWRDGMPVGSPFWGTGVFQESAELVLEFVFDTLEVQRLEAHAAVPNGRDHTCYSILATDRRALRTSSSTRTH